MEFPIKEIAEILKDFEDDADILEHLRQQQRSISEKEQHYNRIRKSLNLVISHEQEAMAAMHDSTFQVEEKTVEPMLIAGVRMKGKYSDCGKGFSQIGRKFGRHICGKAMLLHFDTEYKENDADFEACMPIRKGESVDDITVRELPGGRCLSLLHRGPYEELGRSYDIICKHYIDNDITLDIPSREIYLKGPGIIFKGNPKKYLTEIQMMIKE